MSGDELEYEYMPATMCYAAKHETNFAEMDMDTMKAMVKASNPGEVHNVSRGWKDVHTQLVGGSGGGIKGTFDAAVNEVLQHWEGPAAEKFRTQAQKISKKISDGALYADYTSTAMGNAAKVLEQLKPDIESMEKPSAANKAINWLEDGGRRDDSGLKNDLKNPGMSTADALDRNSGSLSAGKEQQLRMAVKMEQLGAAYVSQAKSMGSWATRRHVGDREDYPGPPDGDPPTAIPMPIPTGSSGPKKVGSPSISGLGKGPGFSAGGIKSPGDPGISGGIGSPQPGKGSLIPHVGTGLDSFNPPGTGSGGGGIGGGGIGSGLTGVGGSGGVGGGSIGSSGVGGGGGSGVLGTGPGSGVGIGVGGLPGKGGRAPGAGGAGVGKSGSGAGAGGGAGGAGARGGGRAGMPGMGGAAGAGKGAGAKGAGAGRGAALARQKGGVIGSGGGKASGAGQGGSGLHRSRGGAQAGAAAGGRRPAGMGAPGAHGAKNKEKAQNGERPDYLVEDEETWASERSVAPKVIE
ncbi:hypothetical protein ACFVTP_36920 [Streptomyces celluloflavus]|uniref:hypothetical protein n=1 Tax=Streptomyces celluloflavus TaxID=58344 RepID=UPI0036D8EC89